MFEKIINSYPELTSEDFAPYGCIELRDDGDGIVYLHRWEYDKPIPKGIKLGK